MFPEDGRIRVMIEGVTPQVDGGRFPIKRTVGENVVVEADIFCDSHDVLSGVLLWRGPSPEPWRESPMRFLVNDRWRSEFAITEAGRYRYTVEAWVDHFASWRRDLIKKFDADQDVSMDLLTGALLADKAAVGASGDDVRLLTESAQGLRSDREMAERIELALREEFFQLMSKYPDRRLAARYDTELEVVADRERARFSTWYELFPRSCVSEGNRHGTFGDCEARLPAIAAMGFDVLYLPPIHPIGTTHRKGRNNSTAALPDDPGSPWAIGSEDGGHTAVHPELGTLDDFRRLAVAARRHDMEIALDMAFQCSPDHPFVRQHPEWFHKRPDGSIQYAENPPKKYQDIYPLNFETEHWKELWTALRDVVLFWAEQDVRIFRVDNPHTKSFAFWEWMIREVKEAYPDVLFLAEAFTRPKVMYRLAKLGFTQSYTYFAWRNTAQEITSYFEELTGTEVREFFRPSLWPNTPDILTEFLQVGGRPGFVIRLVLAATLGAAYGIYGPAFELGEHRHLEWGGEEYLDSEKFEIRRWDVDRPDSLKAVITRVNRIRRENPALQSDRNLTFHPVENENLICYSKNTPDLSNIVLTVVNLDPHHTQGGRLDVPEEVVGIDSGRPYQVHDLLSDARYLWQGGRNYVELDPRVAPAQIFRIRRKIRTERDFDYFM